MNYTTFAFLAFLCVTVLMYYILPRRAQWVVLLVASTVFYLAGGVRYIVYLIASIVTTYIGARMLAKRMVSEDEYIDAHRDEMSKEERKAYKAKGKKSRFRLLCAVLVINFAVLAVIKYTGFTLSAVNDVLTFFGTPDDSLISVPSIILPLGISFYTFRATGYIIDVYRKRTEAEKNIFKYALFVSFFPLVLQGPISRHKNLSEQFFAPHAPIYQNLSAGFFRIVWGFFKKVVIADTAMIGVAAVTSGGAELGGMYTLYLAVMYSIVIYGDFTGGIDITMGISKMLGICPEENFLRPFSSKSTQEYWNRWHITMGSWFTDYVFYPLSVASPMQKLTKWSKKHLGNALGMRLPVYLATMITWYLTGLWHGAGWNFIVWGLINGVIILVSREFDPLYKKFRAKFPRLTGSAPYGVFCAVRTFLLMGLVRIFDCYRDVPTTFVAYGKMVYDIGSWRELFSGEFIEVIGLSALQYAVILVGCLIVFICTRKTKSDAELSDRAAERPVLLCIACTVLIFACLIFGSYGIGFDSNQFIYNQF